MLDFQGTDAIRSLDAQQRLDWQRGYSVIDPAGGSNLVTLGTGDYELDAAAGDVLAGGTVVSCTAETVDLSAEVETTPKAVVLYRDTNGDLQYQAGPTAERDPAGNDLRQTPVPYPPSLFNVDGVALAVALLDDSVGEITNSELRDRRVPSELLVNNLDSESATIGTATVTTLSATEATVSTSPTDADDVTPKEYVDSVAQGLDWQDSVIDEQNDPPGSPSTGDRYLVDDNPTGDWSGHPNEISEWDGSAWVFFAPNEGWATFLEDVDRLKVYNNTNWIDFGSAIDHGALAGLGDDDHTQYLLVDGTRAMAGALDMGSNAISNASNVESDAVENQDYNESTVTHSVSGGGTVTVDLSAANVHRISATGDFTLEVSNVTSTPEGNSVLLKLLDGDGTGPHTITYGSSWNTILWSDATVRDEISASSNLRVSLETDDGGSEWWGIRSGSDFA